MRDIDLLMQDIRCCDEVVMTEENKLEFTWECWFDVDAYFGTDTQHGDEVWLDFLTYWDRFSNEVTAFYVVNSDSKIERHEWKLTGEEQKFLRQKMEQYIGGLVKFYDDCDGKDNLAKWEIEEGKYFRLKTGFAGYSKYNGDIVSVVRPCDERDFVRADRFTSIYIVRTSDGSQLTVFDDELEKLYNRNEDCRYIISLTKIDDETYSVCCNEAVVAGKTRFLHNELGCSVKYEGGVIKVLRGWHIGTEDFSFEGDGYEWVLEKYHPGISYQLSEMLNARKDVA